MRRLALWLNLSTDLNPSQLVTKAEETTTAEKIQPIQKRASSLHPERGDPTQERGGEHDSSSHSDIFEMRPDLPGTVNTKVSSHSDLFEMRPDLPGSVED